MSLRDLVRLLPVIVLLAIVSGAVAFLVSTLIPTTYRADARLTVGRLLAAPGPSYDDLLISQSLAVTYAELATTRPVVAAALQELGSALSPADVSDRIEAQATNGSFIELEVEDSDPARAAALANALAQQLVDAAPQLTERQLTAEDLIAADLLSTGAQIEALSAEITELEAQPERSSAANARLDRLREEMLSLRAARTTLLSTSAPSSANIVTLVEEAVSTATPVSPQPLLNALVASFAALALAIGVAYVTGSRDNDR